jgi:NAD(P)H-dependent flavin oxidoreductase YrpB (nitropropane dioxygenase family)
MRTALARSLGTEFPIFAFTHCRDVAAAVTKAGGMGVLGALGRTPEHLDMELTWIEDQVGDLPYGVDIVIPATSLDRDSDDPAIHARLEAMIPAGHRQFVEDFLLRHQIGPPLDETRSTARVGNSAAERELVDIVLGHKARLLVNALGPMPKEIVDRAHDRGLLAGGLVGSPAHAARQRAHGVDVIIAQGSEAAGHTGRISTMVLVPQVVDAVHPAPVLAAGGVASGRQIAAAMALGAQGVWTGTIWLTVDEADTDPQLKARLLAATSSDTVQTRSLTGKPNRFLRTAWTDAWDAPDAPQPLPWPLQLKLTSPALARVAHAQKSTLIGTSVGQGIGMISQTRPAKRVLQELVEQYVDAVEALAAPLR